MLARIFEEHDRFIRSVIRFSARNRADQEDIYQEVFLALFVKKDLDQILSIKDYLYRLIVNKSNEFLRQKLNRQGKHHTFMERQSDEAVPKGRIVWELVSRDEMQELLDCIREHLTEKESEAILLRYRDGKSVNETAEKMNVRKKTVICYVSVGLNKLRKIVQHKKRRADEGRS